MKNCIDMPIFHSDVCVENVTNITYPTGKNLTAAMQHIAASGIGFFLRHLERKRSRNGEDYEQS